MLENIDGKEEGYDKFPPISVVVPAFNEEVNIKCTLDSLLSSDYPCLDEILVVDDGSTDDTAKIAESYSQVTVIKNSHHGKVYALNVGCKKARNQYVFTIDADTFVNRDAFSKIIELMQKCGASSVSGSLTVSANSNRILRTLQEYEFVVSDFSVWIWQKLHATVPFGKGALTCYLKSAIEQVEYFDGDTRSEDLDMMLKLERNGFKSLLTKEILGRTEMPHTLSGLFRQRVRWFTGMLESFWKHRQMFTDKRFVGLAVFSLS